MATSTILKNMQNPSIVLYGAKSAKLEDKPIPALLDPHDILIRIAYIGVCGSDVHVWNYGGMGHFPKFPSTGTVMGHEASGLVHSIGSQVTNVKPGDRVAIEPGTPCRHCKACKNGTYHLCQTIRFAAAPGYGPREHTDGTLAKYFRIAEDFVYKVPESMGLQETVLVEPLSVAVHSIKLVDVRAGETVVVMGSGTVGLLCAAVAKAFGAHRVILVDILAQKLEFAKKYLDCETFQSDPNKTAEENSESLLKNLGIEEGDGVDVVVEASGAASSIETGIFILRPGGKYVQTGMGKAKVQFPIAVMTEKELMVRGHFRYGAGDYELAVGLLTKGIIDVKPLISSVSPFEEATKAWEKTARGEGIKNLIQGVQD